MHSCELFKHLAASLLINRILVLLSKELSQGLLELRVTQSRTVLEQKGTAGLLLIAENTKNIQHC